MRDYLLRWDFWITLLLAFVFAWFVLRPLVLNPGTLILHIDLPPLFPPQFPA